jgi:hypothetical protein
MHVAHCGQLVASEEYAHTGAIRTAEAAPVRACTRPVFNPEDPKVLGVTPAVLIVAQTDADSAPWLSFEPCLTR